MLDFVKQFIVKRYISMNNKSGSRHLSKSGEAPMAEKDIDWYDLFWAKHRQELSVDTYKYKSGE